jgi:flagellin
MISMNNNMGVQSASTVASLIFAKVNTSLKQLASGLRIVSAQDDAAGLAVRELMRANLATARQGSANVRDSISMLQTADGAAGAINDNLIRMKQLATQAATGTYSAQQKSIMQQEFTGLADEINRITQTTSFNGVNMFSEGQTIQIALGDGDTINIDTQAIGVGSIDIITDPDAAAEGVNSAISRVSSYRGEIGSKASRLESAAAVLDIKSENLLAAESRISDVDVARTVTTLAANKVLASAAVAIQSQANAMAQAVQMLLG